MKRLTLIPAIRKNGKIHTLDRDGVQHEDIIKAKSLGLKAHNNERGFLDPSDKFLNREEAMEWLEKSKPELYETLHDMDINELRSGDLLREEEKPDPNDKIDLSTKTAIVYDRGGLYLYAAEKLAEKYGKVMYYLADSDAYPTSQKATIGAGLPRIKRIHDFYKHIDEADILYFFDCYDGELQHWLRGKGYTVFGSGRGEKIEIDKIFFLEKLDELGLPKAETYIAHGMADLCDYLKKNDGKTLYLKNLHRGDFESRKFTSMAQSRPFLDDLKKRLGSASDTIEVLIQHKIESACEAGYDGFNIDGQFTDNCIVGYEVKDRGFVGKVLAETPEILKKINDAFAPILKKLGGRSNYSTEVRITENGDAYYIDPTQRAPSPPGEGLCEIYENWAEAIWLIANGVVPVLDPKAAYLAEVILYSKWHCTHEINVKFPKKYRQFVKLKNHTIRDGEYYCIPNGNDGVFGAVVGWGNTKEEAIKKVCEVAESIEADEYHFDCSVFDEAEEAVQAGEKFGINWGDK